MAFLWGTSGGLQSTAVGMEWATSTNGSPAIETSIVRQGGTAIRFNNAAAAENIQHVFRTTQGVVFIRWYLNIQTAPATTRTCLAVFNSSNSKIAIKIMGGADARKLQLFNDEDNAQIGSNSAALNANQYYRLELKIDSTTLSSTSVEARLYKDEPNPTLDWNPSGTANLAANPDRWWTGIAGSDANADFIVADAQINDDSGSYENTWVGDGWLLYMRPNAAGDSAQWSRGGADSGANWSQTEETTPNDATDYVESNTNDQVDEYNLDATPAKLGPDDVIRFVAPSARFAVSNTSGADPDFVVGVRDGTGGSFDESGNLSGAGSTFYTSHKTDAPKNYPSLANNSNYERPGTSSSWTKTSLDTMQFRIRETVTDTHFIRVSAAWVLVGVKPTVTRFYLPSSGTADVSPSFDGGWEETGSADRLEMVLTKISSAMSDKSVTTIASAGDALCRQYVSEPINAVALTGDIKCYARANEALATVDALARIKVYVVSNDGGTVRGTLLSLNDYSTGTEFNTSNRNKAFADGDTPSSVSAQAGDRIVLEIGFNHAAVISSAAVNFGDDSASDLLYDETTTSADNPYLEFGQTISLQAAGGRTTKNTDPRPLGQFVGMSRTMINPPV